MTAATTTTAQYMSPAELAQRWGVTTARLANDRYQGRGPAYLKLGHQTVRYSVQAVEEFEQENMMRWGSR